MPPRPERLIWLHGRALDIPAAVQVGEANERLVARWNDCGIDYRATVDASGVSDRLWLFGLKSADQKVATRLGSLLKEHIAELRPLKLKRQVNLPTPLLTQPEGSGHKLDIGLHVVSDEYNATLMLFLYWEGRYYNPPHLQLADMHHFADVAGRLWTESVCTCRPRTGCCDYGCFKCFRLDCDACNGTGWKGFARWQAQGCRIDYGSGWPLALVPRPNKRVDPPAGASQPSQHSGRRVPAAGYAQR